MTEEWGPWIEHDAGPCPHPVGVDLIIRLHCGCEKEDRVDARDFGWPNDWEPVGHTLSCIVCDEENSGHLPGIVAYRTLRPRALQQLKDMVESLPETEDA